MISPNFRIPQIFLIAGVILTAALNATAIEIKRPNFHADPSLGNIKLYHDEKGFFIKRDGKNHEVQNCFVAKEIKGISNKQLEHYLGNEKEITIGDQELVLTKISPKEFERYSSGRDAIQIELSEEEQDEVASKLFVGGSLVVEEYKNEEGSDFHIKITGCLKGGQCRQLKSECSLALVFLF